MSTKRHTYFYKPAALSSLKSLKTVVLILLRRYFNWRDLIVNFQIKCWIINPTAIHKRVLKKDPPGKFPGS